MVSIVPTISTNTIPTVDSSILHVHTRPEEIPTCIVVQMLSPAFNLRQSNRLSNPSLDILVKIVHCVTEIVRSALISSDQ